MAFKQRSTDQTPRDGGDATDEQLEGAIADGSPGPKSRDADSSAAAAELAEERDRNLRLRAELENVRSRSSRELAEQLKYAVLPMARDLLPVLDNIDRALAAAEKSGETGSLVEGFRLIRQQLVTLLEQYQCTEIAALGEPFDPQFHAAILHQPSPTAPANHVSLVAQAGYRMHDRVVRPAQVIVSAGRSGDA